MGKHKYIESPQKLLSMWDEYKKTVDQNPDKEQVATGKGEILTLTRPKPYLRRGFEAYVYRTYGFHVHQYIDNDDKNYTDYLGVVTCMRKEWESDQISGTLTGKYKSQNLVARLNGLVDKKQTDIKGSLNVPNLPDIGNRE
jgi:hypothetical protein